MSRKNKSGNIQKQSVGHSQTYFSCWEYRENETDEYKIILSLFNNKDKDMFLFPYENKFGHRSEYFIPNNDKIKIDMFGLLSICKKEYGQDFIGFSFICGGDIIGEIPSHWKGDKVKLLTKKLPDDNISIDFNPKTFFYDMSNLYNEMKSFCRFTET
jgi:hypothetical protein